MLLDRRNTISVKLACVKHIASVHSKPGSNSSFIGWGLCPAQTESYKGKARKQQEQFMLWSLGCRKQPTISAN